MSRCEDDPLPFSAGFSEKTPRFVGKRQRRRSSARLHERDGLPQELSEGLEVAPHERPSLTVVELREDHGDVRERDVARSHGDQVSSGPQRAAEPQEQRHGQPAGRFERERSDRPQGLVFGALKMRPGASFAQVRRVEGCLARSLHPATLTRQAKSCPRLLG